METDDDPSTDTTPSRTPRRLPQLFSQLTFYLVPSKLDVHALDSQICQLGGEVVGKPDARVVITALKGRPRLERVLGNGISQMTNLLSQEFVTDTYALAQSGNVSTPLPNREAYRVFKPKRSRSPSIELISPKRQRRNDGKEVQREVAVKEPKPDITPYPPDIRLSTIPRMCVQRPCPLTCPNQDIIDAIKPIYVYREFDEADQKNSNVLSYRRSMSILKSVPRRLKSAEEARKLVDVGEKVAQRIEEFLSTGRIAESETILASQRYTALMSFSSIYGIGTTTAAELWDKGCRTLEDVGEYYGCDAHPCVACSSKNVREERKAWSRRMEGTMTRHEVVCTWLELKEDLDQTVPRAEAEEIATVIMQNADALHPGCQWTISGGYRRGKETTSDVDVIFSPPADDPHLLKSLCRRLGTLGIVTHVLHRTTRDPTTPLHTSGANFDNLDKAFVILRLPKPGALHRRVDIIAAPKERYAAAVLSWSGSMMFERDLRRVAEDQGYKFRAGLLAGTQEINFPTEREILAFLGLAYVPPELRNADG